MVNAQLKGVEVREIAKGTAHLRQLPREDGSGLTAEVVQRQPAGDAHA